MDWVDRKQIGEELLNNMDLTKEQYISFCKLADEMDLMYEFGYKLPDDTDVEPEKEEKNGK
jgi:Fe-S-cluster formation regulator IscX/YfhJ